MIRPAGYFRVKARRLRSLLEFLIERYDGSLEKMFRTGLPELREELLAVNGIGPETADSILLYAGNLPTFVVDAYTHRVLARHGWIDFEADYHQIQDYLLSSLPQDVQLYNEFHALIRPLGQTLLQEDRPQMPRMPVVQDAARRRTAGTGVLMERG